MPYQRLRLYSSVSPRNYLHYTPNVQRPADRLLPAKIEDGILLDHHVMGEGAEVAIVRAPSEGVGAGGDRQTPPQPRCRRQPPFARLNEVERALEAEVGRRVVARLRHDDRRACTGCRVHQRAEARPLAAFADKGPQRLVVPGHVDDEVRLRAGRLRGEDRPRRVEVLAA